MTQPSSARILLVGLIVCSTFSAYVRSQKLDSDSQLEIEPSEYDPDLSNEVSETEFDNCKIDIDPTNKSPWLGYLRISNETANETQHDWYWPVIVIGPTTLLTGADAFRSPYSDRKLKVEDCEMYHVRLKDNLQRNVSSKQFNPGIADRAQHWMKVDNDFTLIRLTEPINFTSLGGKVRPLCLPSWNLGRWNQLLLGAGESLIEPRSVTIISGWKCNDHNALLKKDASIHMQVNTSTECKKVWRGQADYSAVEGTKYVHRICGTPMSTNNSKRIQDSENPEEHGLCAEKFYFNIHTRNGNERVLSGIFNGIAHEVYTGPTAYVHLLNEDVLAWIHASIECGPHKFTCHSGDQCVGFGSVCDQIQDCADNSDENGIYCRARRYCTSSEYACGVYNECLESSDVAECDGVPDCEFGDDEDEDMCHPYPFWWIYLAFLLLSIMIFVCIVFMGYDRVVTKQERIYLTHKEIAEFRQGIITNCGWVDDNCMEELIGVGGSQRLSIVGTEGQCQLNSMQMPYIYNIKKSQIKFCEKIGEGAFGVVRKGIVAGKTVAIKVLKSDLVNKEMFKTFLVELKIMAFVNFIKGGHDNVIRLVGAYTEEIRNCQLFIVVEYCQFGSIADCFRDNREYFRSSDDCDDGDDDRNESLLRSPPSSYVSASSIQPCFGIHTLHSWTLQIVDGMHFLARHKIIHGDLAIRNVLLDYNLTAKISDFGLSRQMYLYRTSCATVCKNTKLPWKWMAPEVLRTMKISSKSDVWSFGVTLWELYELGSVPYGGLEWSPYFVEQLKCGTRLPKPQYANDELFKVIRDCWLYAAEHRPDFETLRDILCSLSWTDLDLHLFSY